MMTNLLNGAHVANKLFSTIARLRLLLVMFLTLTVSANVWGAEVTFTTTSSGGFSSNSKTADGVTVKFNGSPSWQSGHVRVYSKATISFSSTNNNITKIVMTATSSDYAKTWSADVGSTDVNNTTITWTGSAKSITLTNTASAQSRLSKIVVTTADSYTVTWTINPATGGTLSATSGNSTTVSPNAAYTYGASAYTVTSGEATVSQSGNTFTATPTANSTIQINMVEKTPATISFENIGNPTPTTTGYYVGDTYTLPATNDYTCGDKTFVGWSTEIIENSATKPTAATYFEPGASVTLAANQTFYAVFATSSGNGSGYTKLNWGATISAGKYLISTGNYTISGRSGNKTSELAVVEYSPTSNEAKTEYEVKIEKIGDYFSIKLPDDTWWVGWNTSTSTNLTNTSPNNDTDYLWQYTENGIQNISAGTRYLQVNYANSAAKVYTTTNSNTWNATYLYAQATSYSDYTTQCITQPSQLATPINLRATNITSASATLLWDKVANANEYKIKKGNNVIVSTGYTSCDLSGLEPSTKYTYCVYAVATGYTNSEETCVTFTTATAPANVVNWVVKGENKTTAFNGQSTNIYQLADDELKCGEKDFIGWTATKDYENATTAPTDLFTTTFLNEVTEGTTFYAVYADKRTTTSITYTWDMVKQYTTPALAAGDQIVITAKNADYALSTTQNTYNRGAVEITKHATGDSITINPDVQILTLGVGSELNTFTLSPTTMYLMAGKTTGSNTPYIRLSETKNQASAWTIGFTDETTPYVYVKLYETKNGKGNKQQNYYYYISYTEETEWQWYVGSVVTDRYFTTKRADNNTRSNPKNISIYRRTAHTTEKTTTSGYTTDCGCSAPAKPLAFSNKTITADKTLTLTPDAETGNGGAITYTCSDATHTTINGYQFSATALDIYTITATQGVNGNKCGAIVDFTVTVECATPSITPTTDETTINTPVDLKSIITSTSPMPLTFACTDENVYISGTNFTFLAAGSYTITATQEAGGIYCDGSQEITITVADPCEDKTKPDVTATANETTITVVWDALDDVTTYRVYNNTTGDSDETTDTSYPFSGLNPSTEYSWTVEAVYSDGCTAAASGATTTSTPDVQYDVNWYVAGEAYTTYGGSTSVSHGEQISSLPKAPVPDEHSCGDKEFVGWSKSQFLDGSRPTDLFTTVVGSPAITAATTFYAVFADCVTGGDTPEDDTQGEWTLVTDMSVLEVGTKIFIAAANEDVALSTTQNNNNRAATSIIKSGNTATIDEATQVLTLETGTKSGTWAFNTGDGYLYAASSGSNYLRTIAELDDNGSWTIFVTNTGIATIKAQGSNTRNWLRKNSNSALFSCYSSGQDDVVIYYKSAESTPVDPTEYTVTLSVLGETSEENTTSNYTLPIDVDAACVGKTFVGWTTTENLSSPTEPISNYWAKGTPVTITEDKTYYAVFATESTGGGEGVEQTMTFSEYFKNGEEAIAYAYVAGEGDEKVAVEFDCGTNEQNCPTYYDNGEAVRMYEGNNIVVYHRNETLPLTKIQFTFSSTTYDNLSLDDTGVYDSETCTWIGSQTEVWFTATDGARIQSVTITIGAGTTYSNFSTTCDGGDSGSGDGGDTDGTWTIVTSESSLAHGDKVIIAASGYNYALSTTQNNNNRGAAPITKSGNTATIDEATQVLTLETGTTNGTWAFNTGDGYLYAASSSNNYLRTEATLSENSSWTIDISNNSATITAQGSNTRNTIRYNTFNNANIFSCYASNNTNDGINAIALYKLTSTPASAPARKVAMKKAAAVRAEKSEMVTRPVVKAPAALAAQECTSYENYTTICCAYPIKDLKFAAGANSITLYWNTAAASATATLYNDEECTSQVTDATKSGITNGTWTFTGLAKTTTYYAMVSTTDGCTAVLEVSTERPHVSVAEWAANHINIDVNTNEPITVVLENEVTGGSTTGNQATELFFSKYYEATANVKLVAVYNGTDHEIDLTNYIIKYGKTSWATNYIQLVEFATTANGFAKDGYLSPGEEMILYTKNVSDSRDVAIMDCVTEAYPDGKWIEVTTTNNEGGGSLSFGGDKTIALFKEEAMIDIIGGGTASSPNNSGADAKPAWGDAKGWTCDEGLSIDDGTMIGISTNRCLLVRNNTVTSGENAVNLNEEDFVTLCTEWKGAHVPDDDIDDGVAASCENFAFVGTFDYSDYYVKYEKLGEEQTLPTEGRLEDGTYQVETPDLHDIACTNMRISLKDAGGNTLVTQDLKVPIIIDQNVQTDNKIYFQYPQRTDVDVKPDLGDQNENILTPEICAECDVIIRDSKQLTHVAEGVSEFNNMMVYPGAKFVNSTSQEFYLNTLQMQAKNDEVSYAIINNDGSTIDVGDMVFVKRIDDKYWYQFSLPYDCKVSDIIQQDGQSMGKYWVDWGIKYYNGKRRQEEGTAASAGQVSQYWEKVEETATLKAHQGYIIGLFTTEWKDQMKFVYFTPVTTNPYRESGDDAKTTTVNSWYTTPPTTDAPRHHGWNFTGSPYISIFNPQTPPYYDDGESSVLMSGTFDPANPDAEYISGDVYLSIPVLPDGLYYNQVLASSTSLMPFRAYFVQTVDPKSADEQHTLTYAKGGRQLPSAPARAAATKQRVLVELNITAPDGQTDNTGVWVDERYTTDYEIAADLTKMYVAGTKPQLYTLAANNEKLAYNALSDDAATNVPIELYAPLAGDYTLTLNDRVSRIAGAESIELLHDGQVVANLLIQDYTITANKGTVSGYSLSIRRRADVSTAVDNTTGSTITLIANDEYISLVGVPTDATISIYDMLGRLITSQQANGQSVVNLSIVPQGVYNIVVANGTGYTTIKSVIK